MAIGPHNSIWQRKPWRYWSVVALLILVVKGCFALVHGLQLFPDSYNYLVCIVHSDYPAGYPLFLNIVQSISESPAFLILLQTAIFAASTAFLLRCLQLSVRWTWIVAIVLALEPTSTLFCSSVMSEALFVPLLLMWSGAVLQQLKTAQFKWLIVAAVLAGLMYSMRFAAVIPAIVPIIVWLGRKQNRKQALKWIPIYVLVFQVVLLPFRWQSQKTFDTWQLNGLAGVNLWNNTSVLYDGASMQQQPETAFERHLAAQSDWKFSIDNALHTRQIWDTASPYRTFIEQQGFGFNDAFKASSQAGDVGWKLLLESPTGYFTDFVIPNLAHAFSTDIHLTNETYTLENGREVKQQALFISQWTWRFELGMLLLCTVLFFILKARISLKTEGWTLLLIWTYLLALPVITSINLRYFLSVNCLVLLLFLLLISKMVKGTKAAQSNDESL